MQKNAILIKIKEFFIKFYSGNKKMFFTVIALVLILVVSLLSMFSSKKKQNMSSEKGTSSTVSYDSYASEIENKIESMLCGLKSVSEVQAFVMLETSPIKNYLTETEKQTSDSSGESVKETVVFEKDGSVQKPVETFVAMPKITGVLIVVNKIDASTKVAITNALAVVLNVSESSISILQEK